MDDFVQFLREIAPYVVIVGSFARGDEGENSDIDCFLRSRPCDEVDPEGGNEDYMPEVLEIIKRYGYETESCSVGHITVKAQKNVLRMVEIATLFAIPHTNPITTRNIYGVSMLCAVDDKHCPYKHCYDNAVWDDDAESMVINYPLPAYQH